MKSKFFSSDYLQSLPDDELDALSSLCNQFRSFEREAGGKTTSHEDYLEIYSILDAFTQHRGIRPVEPTNVASPNAAENINAVRARFTLLSEKVAQRLNVRSAQVHVAATKQHYAALFAGVSCYAFTDNDFARIQTLINELRDLITTNKLFNEEHRSRMLRRLEAMQRELHKKTSDIDRFWGFIGEAGMNARKFGEDLKPITDRVRELVVIVYAVICLKEGIALTPESVTQLLPGK